MPSAASRARVMAKLVPALERLLERYDTFTEISVEALMSEAGMSRRSFYAYFGDKGQLMAEVAAEVIAQMTSSWQPWWDRVPQATPTDLDLALTDMVTIYQPHRRLLRAVAETTTYDQRVADIYNSGLGQTADRLRAYIAAGQAEGVIRPQLHAQTAATWLTILLSAGLVHLASAPQDEHDRHLAAAREILWRVLYPPELDLP